MTANSENLELRVRQGSLPLGDVTEELADVTDNEVRGSLSACVCVCVCVLGSRGPVAGEVRRPLPSAGRMVRGCSEHGPRRQHRPLYHLLPGYMLCLHQLLRSFPLL